MSIKNLKKLNIIINGGKSKIGIESTVIDLTEKPKILRPGIISAKDIKKSLKIVLSLKKTKIKSPGMLKSIIHPDTCCYWRKTKKV